MLDDRIVAERLADLGRDAALSWQDPAHLRTLGATVVGELRYQGERKGWDAGRTDKAVRTGLSDLYAGAVEAARGQDPERAANQPERQAAVVTFAAIGLWTRQVATRPGGLRPTNAAGIPSERYSAAIDWVAGLL